MFNVQTHKIALTISSSVVLFFPRLDKFFDKNPYSFKEIFSVTNLMSVFFCCRARSGAGVTTTRAHVHYIVTEFGVAYLFGKNLRQRAYELIRISHPSHREDLEKAAYERLKVMPAP